MCAICGCSGRHHGGRDEQAHAHAHDHAHEHSHDHAHEREHAHGDSPKRAARLLRLEQDVLALNDTLAQRNRDFFAGRGVLTLNLVSSPGAGKTTLLERMIRDLGASIPMCVVEGDQATDYDAARIRAAGCRAVQINTGAGCHLDAAMVWRAVGELNPPPGSVVFIENVGNLVCPALFDLGEHSKVLVCSVAEGEDKPLKYPHMFRASRVLLLSKIDLLPYVSFDVDRFLAHVHQVNPTMRILRVSASRGEGLDALRLWLRAELLGAGAFRERMTAP